jgi:hypothetical protein
MNAALRIFCASGFAIAGVLFAWWQHVALDSVGNELVARIARSSPRPKPTSDYRRSEKGGQRSTGTKVLRHDSAARTASASFLPATRPDPIDLFVKDIPLNVLFLDAYKAAVRVRFQAFFQRRAMSTEQIDQFERIMAASTEAWTDLQATARSQGLNMSDPSIKILDDERIRLRETQLQTLLGADGLQSFHEYRQLLTDRKLVEGIAPMFSHAGDPISGQQIDQLTQIWHDVNSFTVRHIGGEVVYPAEGDFAVVRARSDAILNDRQRAILDGALKGIEADIALRRKSAEATIPGFPKK